MTAGKKQLFLAAFLTLGGALALLIGWKNLKMGRNVGTAVILGGILLKGILYRCPHCGRYLGRSFRPGMYCPHCGKNIE